jgi:uncharacterized membrane protein
MALAIASITIAGSAIAQATLHDRMPEQVPVHWGIDGQPDRWVPKNDAFQVYYLMPLIGAGTVLLGLFLLPWLSPRNFAVESFRRTYDYVILLVAGLLAFLQGVLLSAGIRGGPLPERIFIAGILVFFALIGNVLGKVRPNFWMGVRTPWTLADPQVWTRTHRMAAWCFTAAGVIGAAAVLLGAPLLACLIGVIAACLWPVLYSLILYKRLERAGQLDVQRSGRESVAV